MTKLFIINEIVLSAIWLVLGLQFVHLNGVVGLCHAYHVTYFLDLIFFIFVLRKILFK